MRFSILMAEYQFPWVKLNQIQSEIENDNLKRTCVICINLYGSIEYFGNCLNFYVIAVNVIVSFARYIAFNVFRYKLHEIFAILILKKRTDWFSIKYLYGKVSNEEEQEEDINCSMLTI